MAWAAGLRALPVLPGRRNDHIVDRHVLRLVQRINHGPRHILRIDGDLVELLGGLAALGVRDQLPKSMSWRTVRREPLVVLAHRRHAWADPLALLASQPHIRYDRHNWGGALSEQYLQSRRIQPKERVELDALDALEVLVGLGLGVSLVPDWARAKPLAEHLVALPVPESLYREVGLLWPAGSAHGRLLDALLH